LSKVSQQCRNKLAVQLLAVTRAAPLNQTVASSSPYTLMMGRSALSFRSPAPQGRTSERSQKKNARHCLN
jgi:hypothetical protein